jgi:hypothetical protein
MKFAEWAEKEGGMKHELSVGPFFARVKHDDEEDHWTFEVYSGPILANSRPIAEGSGYTLFACLKMAQDAIRERLARWLAEVDGEP